MTPFADHLWQSTLFAALTVLLSFALRRNRAQLRYRLWLAASLKFLLPFSVLVGIGSQFEWRSAPTVAPPLVSAVEQIGQPFTSSPILTVATPATPALLTAPLLIAVWAAGCAFVLLRWLARWRRIRTAARAASPLPIQAPVEVMSSPTLIEPGVFGIFHPVLLLPEGIASRLSPAQLQAILAHELCHVRRRDNLAAAIHMLVEAIFWFHPLVWWIGARMVEERERACDEEVLRLGSEPQEYAAGILNICKFYLESPLPCASGVTGADLKKRIEAIMTNRMSRNLTLTRKLLLTAAGIAAVAGPVLIGVLRAQSKLTFEVASVKPSDPDSNRVSFGTAPGGGLNGINVSLKQLIAFAYNIQCGKSCDEYISGGPGWINSLRFDIVAKPPRAAESDGPATSETRERTRQRLQALLAERFQLVLHREAKDMSVFALTVAKSGPKFKQATATNENGSIRGNRPGEMIAENVPIQMLVVNLSGMLGRPLLDRTDLKGRYDFKLDYVPEAFRGPKGPAGPDDKPEAPAASDPSGPSIFTALQEQLGLRLDATKGPVEMFVIERAEKPTAN